MKIYFKFTTDVLSHWRHISYLRLNVIEFLLEDHPDDREAAVLLREGFPTSGNSLIVDETNSNVLIMSGAEFRVDLLEPTLLEQILHKLFSYKKLFITDSLTKEPEHNLQIFGQYLQRLPMEFKELEKEYLRPDLLKIVTADWHRGSRCVRYLLDTPENISEEPYRLHEVLMHDIDELKEVLNKIEEDYPQNEVDVIDLEQAYSASISPKQLSVNLFKAVTRYCIKQLMLCMNQLNPEYYRDALHQSETQLTKLLSEVPGYEREKIALIERIHHYFIPYDDINSCNLKQLCTIYRNLNRVSEIIATLFKYHVLNEDTIKGLEMVFLLADDEPNERIIQIHDSIASLLKLDLLMPETILPLLLFNSAFPDKSCLARTAVIAPEFIGATNRDEDLYKRMWTIYSIGAEHQLIDAIREGKSLLEQLNLAASIRQHIAVQRNESNNPYNFGVTRTGKSQQDTYSHDDKSIISTTLFPIVSRTITQNIDLSALLATAPIHEQLTDNIFDITIINKLTCQLDNGEEITLPEEEMHLIVKRRPKKPLKLLQVSVQFSELDQANYEKMLRSFDTYFVTKHHQKRLNDEEFVTKLGKLVFYLVRSYPYNRGTAAILQWETRGLISNYTNGAVNLGDIRLGDSEESAENIPYDVYAHLVQSPEVYAEAFKKSVLPLFAA